MVAGSESGKCVVRVERHIYQRTVISVNYHYTIPTKSAGLVQSEHFCASPKAGPGFSASHVAVFLCLVSSVKIRGDYSFFFIGRIDDCLTFFS